MNQGAKQAAVFLDRDGTLIREVNYLSEIGQIELLPTVAAGLKLLRAHGFKLLMVTNQSVVGRGLLSELGLAKIHAEIINRLAQQGATLDGIYYCPHHPTEARGEYRMVCDCRKPRTGMIESAAADFQIDPAISYVVGDQLTDFQLARAVGATGLLLGSSVVTEGEMAGENIPVVADLGAAAEWIVKHLRRSQSGSHLI